MPILSQWDTCRQGITLEQWLLEAMSISKAFLPNLWDYVIQNYPKTFCSSIWVNMEDYQWLAFLICWTDDLLLQYGLLLDLLCFFQFFLLWHILENHLIKEIIVIIFKIFLLWLFDVLVLFIIIFCLLVFSHKIFKIKLRSVLNNWFIWIIIIY